MKYQVVATDGQNIIMGIGTGIVHEDLLRATDHMSELVGFIMTTSMRCNVELRAIFDGVEDMWMPIAVVTVRYQTAELHLDPTNGHLLRSALERRKPELKGRQDRRLTFEDLY